MNFVPKIFQDNNLLFKPFQTYVVYPDRDIVQKDKGEK